MGIFQRLFGRFKPPSDARQLLLPFLDEARGSRCEDLPMFRAIATAPPELKAEVAVELARIFLPESAGFRRERDYLFRPALVTLWNALCADGELRFDDTQLVVLIDGLARGHVGRCVELAVVSALDHALEAGAASPAVRDALVALATLRPHAVNAELARSMAALGISTSDVGGRAPEALKELEHEHPIEAWLGRLATSSPVAEWTVLLEHAARAANKSRPSQRFVSIGEQHIDAVGRDRARATVRDWLESVDIGEEGIPEDQRDALKGLIWIIGGAADEPLVAALADFAMRCYKKITDVGPTSVKLGNAAVLALGRAGGAHGVGALSAVASRVRYASARRQIERALDDAAGRAGMSRDELEELSVPTFGLGAAGAREQALGNYTAEVSLSGIGAALQWRNKHGKLLKNAPAALREEHGDELKRLRREVKEIGAVASGQLARLEGMWLRQRSLTVGSLRERYLDHPVVGFYAARLLWSVDGGEGWQPVLFRDEQALALGEVITISDEARARLWHPMELESVDEVAVWRDWLAELGVVQPFSQLYRDVYRASERGTDDRFAGNILLQKALREQCRRHGWQYRLQGYWDSANAPLLELSDSLYAEFEADPIEHRGDDHVFEYLISGAVHFFTDLLPDVGGHRVELPPSEVDPLVFSEVMRAVGAMVAASTVTKDPGFAGTGPLASWNEYWQRGAWGALAPAALSRRAVVADILPRTTLRDVAELDDRWLVVRNGTGGQHRIHVGSGLVRSDETGELLEVRLTASARRKVETVFLPFEGDPMLVNILARAFILAG